MKPLFLEIRESFLDKESLFRYLLAGVADFSQVQKDQVLQALKEREKIGDTCIAPGIALAHAQLEAIQRPTLQICRMSVPLLWQNDLPFVNLVILLLLPEEIRTEDQQIMRQLMHWLADEERCEALTKAQSTAELQRLLPLT